MSKITRKIEIIPDIEGLTHDESNKKCYGAFYSFDKNLYKVANLLVSPLYGLDNLLSLMRLQNDEYVKCQSKLSLKSTTDAEKENIVEQRKQDRISELYDEWKEAGEVSQDAEVLATIKFDYHLTQPTEAETEAAETEAETEAADIAEATEEPTADEAGEEVAGAELEEKADEAAEEITEEVKTEE